MVLENINHEDLFSGSSLKLGKIHWYIQKADTEMEKKIYVQPNRSRSFDFNPITLTGFGKDVGFDYIYWWVFRKEANNKELLKRTETALDAAQTLKTNSASFKHKFTPTSYSDLIEKIKDFTEKHLKEINSVYDYVKWLNTKDILAPSILFTYRIWGSTNLGDREVTILSNNIEEDIGRIKDCTETALGLRIRSTYVIQDEYFDISREIAESTDPEYSYSISVPIQELTRRTASRVLDEFAEYFELIRKSLRNIILDIHKYNMQDELLYRGSFWINFVTKVMNLSIENYLWDFKKTFQMWHTRGQEKEKAEFKFCENVASMANSNGGVLIVGVSNNIPRKIAGVDDLENKIQSIKLIINRHLNCNSDFIHLQPINIKDDVGANKICLIIAISQTKDVVSVKDNSGKISYPKRLETGSERMDYEAIKYSKINVLHDNHNYILTLNKMIHD